MHKSVEIVCWPLAIIAVLLILSGEATKNTSCYLLGLALMGVLMVLGLWHERRCRAENEKQPITEVEATVAGHYTRRERVGRTTQTRWYITFDPSDGSPKVDFEVSELDFEDYDMGETGLLRYRGWQFLSFGVKDKSGVKPMAPLPEEYEPKPEAPSAMQRLGQRLTRLRRRNPEVAQLPQTDTEGKCGILTHDLDE